LGPTDFNDVDSQASNKVVAFRLCATEKIPKGDLCNYITARCPIAEKAEITLAATSPILA
jgi:hypothetical protein